MSNEIATQQNPNTALVSSNVTDEFFGELAKGSRFLPRLVITAGLTKQVMAGKIGVGKYGLITGQEIEDLGVEIRAWVMGLRLKAMDVGKDPIVSYYDPKLPAFKDIQVRSLLEKQGPLAGAEFLLYISGVNKFASLFMCSKTMRQEAPNVKLLLGQAATFKITLIQSKKNMWHGPVVGRCAIEIPKPPEAAYNRILKDFLNPPSSEVEIVSKEEKAAAGSQEV